MANLKESSLKIAGFTAHNFPNSSYFHKIFDTQLQKGMVYLYAKNFLSQLLHLELQLVF